MRPSLFLESFPAHAANSIGTGADTIFGDNGNDIAFGGWGADSISGGNGNDLLLGNQDTDSSLGDNGNDFMSGGLGSDTLTGGANADDFVFRIAEALGSLSGTLANDSADYITDFVAGTDFIVFQSAGAPTGALASPNFFGGTTATDYAGALTAAQALMASNLIDVVAIGVGTNTYVFIDDDGVGAGGSSADQVILLQNLAVANVTAASFKISA